MNVLLYFFPNNTHIIVLILSALCENRKVRCREGENTIVPNFCSTHAHLQAIRCELLQSVFELYPGVVCIKIVLKYVCFEAIVCTWEVNKRIQFGYKRSREQSYQ